MNVQNAGILEYTTANPILRIINSIALLFMSILGFKQKVKLIVTNKRVIMDIRNYSLYFFESGTDMINVNRASTITTGFNSTLLIFKKRYISIDNMTIGTDRKFPQKALEDAALNIGQTIVVKYNITLYFLLQMPKQRLNSDYIIH